MVILHQVSNNMTRQMYTIIRLKFFSFRISMVFFYNFDIFEEVAPCCIV